MSQKALLAAGSLAGLLLGAGLARGADVTIEPGGKVTLQQAIDALPKESKDWNHIYLKPGKYKQQLTVQRSHVALIGLGEKPEDVVITDDLRASTPRENGKGTVGTTGSASTYIKAPDFLAANVTFENSSPDNSGQAVALKTTNDRAIFDRCRFLGFQDTLYVTGGRSYFKDCYITGDTDFIFGNGTAVFDHCTINSSDSGYVTAANTLPETKWGLVFLDCTLTASEGVKPGSVYLGRPWQWDRDKKARVAFVRTKMGEQIAAKGWHPWDEKNNTEPGSHAVYEEYGSMDLSGKPLDVSKRVIWSIVMSDTEAKEVTVGKVLGGEDGWDPGKDLREGEGKK